MRFSWFLVDISIPNLRRIYIIISKQCHQLQDKIQELEKENQSITQENLELEKEMAILKQQLQETSHAEEVGNHNFWSVLVYAPLNRRAYLEAQSDLIRVNSFSPKTVSMG